jgi:hypothetical protein
MFQPTIKKNHFTCSVRYSKLAWETTPYMIEDYKVRLPVGTHKIISKGGAILFHLTKNTLWEIEEKNGSPHMCFVATYPEMGVTLKMRKRWRGSRPNEIEGAQAVLQGVRGRVMNTLRMEISEEKKYVEKYIIHNMARESSDEEYKAKEKYYLRQIKEIQTQMRFSIYLLNDDEVNCEKWFKKMGEDLTNNLVKLEEQPERYSVTTISETGKKADFDMSKEQSYIEIADRIKGKYEHGKYMKKIHFCRAAEVINIYIATFDDGEKAICLNPYTKVPHIFFKIQGVQGMILGKDNRDKPLPMDVVEKEGDSMIMKAVVMNGLNLVPESNFI